MQVWSTNRIGLPRAETFLEFLDSLERMPSATHVER